MIEFYCKRRGTRVNSNICLLCWEKMTVAFREINGLPSTRAACCIQNTSAEILINNPAPGMAIPNRDSDRTGRRVLNSTGGKR